MLEGDIKETGIRSVKGSALNKVLWSPHWVDVEREQAGDETSGEPQVREEHLQCLWGKRAPQGQCAYSPERGWASKDELGGATGLRQEGEWPVTVGTLMFTASIWKAIGSIWTRKWTDLIYAFKDHADSGVENRLLGNWSWEAGNGVKVTI